MKELYELENLDLVSSVLMSGLPNPSSDEVPEEVVKTFQLAREQMKAIPESIADFKAAEKEFAILTRAIERLRALSREAAELPEEDQDGRDRLDAELVKLSHVVASIAGRKQYKGPEISVKSKAQAEGSLKIMNSLAQVKDSMSAQLEEQKALVIEAVEETIIFLETISASFPEAESISGIPDLLQRVRCIHPTWRPEPKTGLPNRRLH